MIARRCLIHSATLMLCVASNAASQPAAVGRRELAHPATSARTIGAQSGAQSGQSGAFFIETASGMLGSAIGIGIVGLASNCGVDDLGCVILTLGAGGTLGAIGATVGTTIAARHTGAPRSVIGAALGAVVGTGAGLGIHYLATQAGGSNLGDRAVVPIVIVSQGLMSAAGSRLLGR